MSSKGKCMFRSSTVPLRVVLQGECGSARVYKTKGGLIVSHAYRKYYIECENDPYIRDLTFVSPPQDKPFSSSSPFGI